ncbi:MAG: hypothetical protein LUG19_05710 [Desulfovibrio sp.]|uniref:hypothetical protein n=1 Tax=Desulfovibrio sp. TaxID=885 RepID=UPI00258FE125|nr:hypothetical protein [Desulfovibrio sp.]MCD7983737.1 hypothetical protein [Desulfovibrio sp.]
MNPVIPKNKATKTLEDIPISKELVEWLEKTIPERCPDIMQTERSIWIYAGQRSLVRTLGAAYERQQNRLRVIQ